MAQIDVVNRQSGWLPHSGTALRRLAGAALGAAVFGMIAAAVDARSAAQTGGATLGQSIVAAAGLIAPLAIVVAVLVGAARAVLVPHGFRVSLKSWFSANRRRAVDRSAVLLLGPIAVLVLMLASARWGLFLLASELPPMPTGSALAVGVVLFGAALALGVTASARALDRLEVPMLAPWASLAASLVIVAVACVALVAGGDTGGGGGIWSQFGVLRREELDLRGVGLLLIIALGAAVAPAPQSRVAAMISAAIGVAPLALTVVAAMSALEAPGVALAIERSAPLSSRVLGPMRRVFDGDGDGFSARFGGGDCDDGDPNRNPNADDIPANGVDEDCSGADAQPVAPAVREQESPEARAASASKLPERLNVVLLTIDTLRWDVGYTGYPRNTTPSLDALAKEGVVFEHAYALASYTAKSLPPILIGKYTSETDRGFYHFNRFDKKGDTFVAERLQRAGIRTVSVQGHWYFIAPWGMERGFDVIDTSAMPKTRQIEGDKTWTSDKVSDAVLAQLATPELQNGQFFLWGHYTDPHADYMEHEGFVFGKGGRARYDSEVAFTDHHIGRVLDALRKSPMWDRTVVIVTSDHGEAFGEHGMIRHGFELWEELVRVPFVIRVPGYSPKQIKNRRSLIDLVPTILDLYGLPHPSGEGTDFLSGHSLIADLAGAPGHIPKDRPIFIDMSEGPYNDERRAYIENDLKLVTAWGRPLGMFDLASDPGETKDLLSDRARVAAQLERFKAFLQTLREIRVRRPK